MIHVCACRYTPTCAHTVTDRRTPPLGDINFSARAFARVPFRYDSAGPPRDPARASTLRVATFGGHFKPTPTSPPPVSVSLESQPRDPSTGSLSVLSQVQLLRLVVCLPGWGSCLWAFDVHCETHVENPNQVALSSSKRGSCSGQVHMMSCPGIGTDTMCVGVERICGILHFLDISERLEGMD